MTRFSKFAATVATFLVIAASGLAPGLAPGQAVAQERKDVLRDTFGSWEVRCIEGSDACAMSQIGKLPSGESAMRVLIERIKGAKDGDGRAVPAAMTVTAPLGVLIPYGLRLKIDNDQVVQLQVNRCLPGGCVVQAPMLDEAVNKMKAGSVAKFGFYLNNEILVDISLSGFTKAYNSLTPLSPRKAN